MCVNTHMGFPDNPVVKNLPASAETAGDTDLIPGLRRSPRKGNGNLLHHTGFLAGESHGGLKSISSVQFSHSAVSDSLWLHGLQHAVLQASLSTNSRSLLKLMSIESVMPSSHLILCRSLLLLPSIFSSIKVFSNESALPIRWLKDWSFSFSISPSSEYSGLISFSIECFDLLAAQGTLKCLFQHHSLKASILWLSLLCGPTHISVHAYLKNHTSDYMNLCQKSDVFAF